MHLERSPVLDERRAAHDWEPVVSHDIHDIHDIQLPTPPHWRGSLKLWRQILDQSQLYVSYRPSMFAAADRDKTLARQFDELATIAHAIRRGASIATLIDWLKAPQVRRLKAAQKLRGFLQLMDTVGVF